MARAEVQEVKSRVDTVEVIGRYVTLTPSGKGLKGRCPFHADSSPSLMVSPEKGLWHCFGCGAGGDVIGFLMRVEKLEFSDALARLADEVGVEIGGQEQKGGLLEACAEAEQYFARTLRASAGKKARQYLVERGIAEEDWQRWGLGYSLPAWDGLLRALRAHGVETLVQLGLVIQGKRGPYDRFRDRVIFPLRDPRGRVVAFAGRSFSEDPKYVNTPNTPLFTKGTLLYGLDAAVEPIRRQGRAVLVEGYTDVIGLHYAGIGEAVGSMGTALTEAQARLLSRYTDRVVIAYDRDAAGSAAALRGMVVLRSAGLRVEVAQLPPGEDPDSLVRSLGGEGVRVVLDEARAFHVFFLDSLAERLDLDTVEGKEEALEETRTLWRGISSVPLKQEIARGLARLVDLPEEDVQRVLRSGQRKGREAPEKAEPAELGLEELLLHFLVCGKLPASALAELEAREFCPEYRPIVDRWLELWRAGDTPTVEDLTGELEPEAVSRAVRSALLDVQLRDEHRAVQDAVNRFVHLPKLERRIEELGAAIADAEAAGRREEVAELSREYQELCRQRLRVYGGRCAKANG